MGTLAVGGGILLAAAGYLAPIALGVELGETQLLAAVLHLVGNALLWGMLATAVGAVTGNRSLASATAGGLMVINYFLVGLLPLAASMQGVVKGIPWYWFDGHQPLVHGVDLGYLGIQLAAIIALAAVAWWGVEARDLTRSTDAASVLTAALDRLREDERAARLLDRLQGDARVGSIFTKTAADGQALLVIVAVSMFLMMGLLIGGMYAALAGTLAQMSSSLPEAMLAFIGGGDMTTPEGFYQLETFGIMAPIAVILVAASVGGKALAGEERDRTIGLLLANPVPRRTIVLQKAAAMVVHATVVGAATFAGVLGGSLLGGLGISAANIAATTLHVTLLGTMFGAVALAVGAATGSVRTSTMVTIGVAGAAYFANALLSIGEDLARWAWVSPFEWYLGGDPLNTGVEWSSVALFVGLTLALVAAAVVLFDRRDLRHA
jgi:ABC-2 type transport system permease protein